MVQVHYSSSSMCAEWRYRIHGLELWSINIDAWVCSAAGSWQERGGRAACSMLANIPCAYYAFQGAMNSGKQVLSLKLMVRTCLG